MKRSHRTVHFALWRSLAILLPALFIIAFAIRYGQSDSSAPLQLAPPQSGEVTAP